MSKLTGIIIAAVLAACTAAKTIGMKHEKQGQTPVVTTAEPVDSTRTDEFMLELMKKYPQYFDSILAHRREWNVQVIYTEVDRSANGIPVLRNHYFNLNPSRYFYPASTVKFPVAMLALQRLNELKDKGIDKNSTMITEAGFSGQTPVYNDPTTPDGKPTIAQYIRKILMVSDNDAYNRLYEFLGQEYINKELNRMGYQDVQLLHRLQVTLTEEQNRFTNPVKFLGPSGNLLYDQPMQFNATKYPARKDSMGKAFMSGGKLVNGPMDFSRKNRISLEDLHTMLVSLVFPSKVHAAQRFNLNEDDRQFLLKYMSQFPGESVSPEYDSSYHDAYCKFILYGSEKGSKPKNIRIFNKPGDAYGQMLDVAYVVDYEKKIEFFLSAVIYCNSDGVLNDDHYDYDKVGLPFMKHLGEVIYDYELGRKRKVVPDFSNFIFQYDKQ